MKSQLNVQKVIGYTLFVEIGLIVIQFLYMKIYYQGSGILFTDAFMQDAGFFIFQVLGFFMFILLAQYVFKHSGEKVFRNALLLFFTGAVVEIVFYLFIEASYQGAFLFSVMDKIVSIAFGLIIYYVSKPQLENSDL